MKVIRGASSNPDQQVYKPFPTPGPKWWNQFFFWEWRGGDRIQPIGSGDWFNPPYFPKGFQRDYIDTPSKLFFCWRFPALNWAGYFGAKGFGVEDEAYKHWMCPPEEVYPGSQAIMMMSIRPFASVEQV
jgi:hypothetical protein